MTESESKPDLTAHHFGVTVENLERAVEFYEDVLGLDTVARFTVSGEEFSEGVDVEDATGRFAHLDAGNARIELVEYDPIEIEIEIEERGSESINRRGAKHVGLEVDDIDAFYEGLPDGVETLSEPQTTESGTRILFVRDPEDNLVEVLET
ncbi:MAG: VOC family protein [Halobacteria archaeon]|nr:VOC family protein [Halobacteria archaeon]